ncbi:MAG: hypothetical protein JXO51_04745 [Candidatus Aminicenantes bacterium]|nr:hypothetical protein [Candidatus Aminicenantes bacterium]
MIIALIDEPPPPAARFACRGHGLDFWLPRAFPFCRFRTLPLRGAGFDFALVFGPSLLPVVSAAASRELRGWLGRRRGKAHGAFAPAGKPFFIASRSFLQAEGIALRPGIFKRLRAAPRVAPLGTRQSLPFIDFRSEPRQAETAISDLQLRLLRRGGVDIENLGDFYIEGLPAIGRGSRIGPGVVLKGDIRIGRGVTIQANCVIENSRIGDHCLILPGSVIRDSVVERNVQLGPFCHLRNGARVCTGAKMGNFVEMKKSVLGAGSKAMHLSYIGDATVGRRVNIGAGTITCNFDGKKKNPTRIGDDVFIGSGTELVAPVTIQGDSYVGAGSTITEDVPRHALAVARQRQRNIKGWVLRKRSKKKSV